MAARVPRLKKRRVLDVRPDVDLPPLVGRELLAKVDDILFQHSSEGMTALRPPPTLVVPPSCRPQPIKKPKVIEESDHTATGQYEMLSFWGVWFVIAAAVRFRRPLRRQAAMLREVNARLQDARLRALVNNVIRPEDVGVFNDRITAGRNTLTKAVRSSESALLTVQANARRNDVIPPYRKPAVPTTHSARRTVTAGGGDTCSTVSTVECGAQTARYISTQRPRERELASAKLSRLQLTTPPDSAGGSLARAWRRPGARLGDYFAAPATSGVDSDPSFSASSGAVIPTQRMMPTVLPPPTHSVRRGPRGFIAVPPIAAVPAAAGSPSAGNSPRDSQFQGDRSVRSVISMTGDSPGFGHFPANWIRARAEGESDDESTPTEPETARPIGVMIDPLLSQSSIVPPPTDQLHVRRTAFRPRVGPAVFTNKEFSEIALPTPTQHPSKAYPPPSDPRRRGSGSGSGGGGTVPHVDRRVHPNADETRKAFDKFRGQLHRSRREYHADELNRLRTAEERRKQALPLKRDFLLYECENNEGSSANEVHVRLRRFIRDARLQSAHGIDLERRTAWYFEFYQKVTDTCASATVYQILQKLQPHFENLEVDLLTPLHFKAIVDSTDDDELRTQEAQFVLRHVAKAFRVPYVTFRELLELRHIHFVLPGSVGD